MTLDVNWSSRVGGGPKSYDPYWSGFMNTYNVGGYGGDFQKTFSWTITFQTYGRQKFDTAVDDYGSVYINGVYQFDMGGYGGQTSRTTPGYFSPGTYTITATSFNSGGGPWGIALKWTGIALVPAPTILEFYTNNPEITVGENSTLSWITSGNISGITSVSINQGIGVVSDSGAVTVSPTVTTSYTLTTSSLLGGGTSTTCQAGATQCNNPVTVTVYPKPVIDSFTISNSSPLSGESVTFSWTTTGVASLTLTGSQGAFNGSSPTNLALDGSFTFIAGAGGYYTAKLTGFNPLNAKDEKIISFTVRDETPNPFEFTTSDSNQPNEQRESNTLTINGFSPTQYTDNKLPIKSNYPIQIMINGDGVWRDVQQI